MLNYVLTTSSSTKRRGLRNFRRFKPNRGQSQVRNTEIYDCIPIGELTTHSDALAKIYIHATSAWKLDTVSCSGL